MKPKAVYLLLCALGTLLPWSQFLPWVGDHGMDLRLFFQELFANRIGGFFGMDVIVSALVLFVFLYVEQDRLRLRLWWLPVLAVLLVGVSLGLPLTLYMREVAREARQASNL